MAKCLLILAAERAARIDGHAARHSAANSVRPLKGSGTTSPLQHTIGDDPGICERKTLAWVILVIAGLFEVGWAIGLKYTEGFTRLWPTVGTVLAMIISLWLLVLCN